MLQRAARAVLFSLIILSVSPGILAQGAQQQVLGLVSDAMNQYNNLMGDEAMNLLNQAEAIATQNGITGSTMARVQISKGVVNAGFFMNNAAALDSFKRAVCYDQNIQLDPLVSTPDMKTTFMLAKTQVQSPGSCQALGAGAAQPVPQPQPQPDEGFDFIEEEPVDDFATPVPTCASHIPVEEQLKTHPVPVYLEMDATMEMQLGKVILFYKNEGEPNFSQKEMPERATGYGAKIDCDNIRAFDPDIIYYYIWIMDAGGMPLCKVGTPEDPYVIQMVDQLTGEPPAFPDGAPESRCEACPPWDPQCGGGMGTASGQLGDPCNDMNKCGDGMECVDGFCESSGDEGPAGEPIVHIDVGFGTGGGIVSQSMKLPPDPYHTEDAQRSVDVGGGFALSPMQLRAGLGVFVIEDLSIDANFRANLYFNKRTEYVCDKTLDKGEICPDTKWSQEKIDGQNIYVTREITEPMAWLLTLRARYIFLNIDAFDMYAWGGLGYGSIKHRVVYNDADVLDANGNPTEMKVFPESGMFDISVGIGMAYYFADVFGLMFEIPIDILVPDFAMNFDINAGFQFRF